MDPITSKLVETVQQITSQYITEDPETFTITRRDVMDNRGMDASYREKLEKFRADPKNAELLKPFALPSVEGKALGRPFNVNYGPLGSFPGDPSNKKIPADKILGGMAKPGGDVRIFDFSGSDFIMGQLRGNQQVLNPITNTAQKFTIPIPNVGQRPVTTKNSSTGQTVQAISTYPELKDQPFDIIGHEVAHTTQQPQSLFSLSSYYNKRVVDPLPGDTPENKEYRDYLFNEYEPAARANEYKAWLKARGLNINADMSSDEYKKALDNLRKSSETNPNNSRLKADLEFYGTPQGEALFRGAKANQPEADPTKNKPVNAATTATALAEHWSRMAKKIR